MDQPDLDAAPSKTRLKQAMRDLQKLGELLLQLPDARLDAIEMEDSLRDALSAVRSMRSREARRRQLQYVGKLLRSADVEPLRLAIADARIGRPRDERRSGADEAWRDRLLADEAALEAWIDAHPTTEIQRLRTLIRNARRERAGSAAAQAEGVVARKDRHHRELLRFIRGCCP